MLSFEDPFAIIIVIWAISSLDHRRREEFPAIFFGEEKRKDYKEKLLS